jgi:Mg-chelatase subunit ChlD
MNFEATYIESTTDLQKAGLILKGQARNTNQPVHMILLCDTSGSMEQEHKLESVKRSITLLLSLLSDQDRLSLITFSDNSKVVLSRATPTADDRHAIQYRVDSLTPDGSTNLSAALLDVRNLVEPESSGRKQGVILLTDGHANVGVIKEEGILEIVKRIQLEAPGLSITTVAYGVDHNAELLTNLAKAGGGGYNVVKNLEDVATVFGDILGGLVSVSVQGVTVQLPPGAQANTSYRCEKDAAGMTTIYVGDIYADSEIVILFKNKVSNGPIRIQATNMATLDRIDEVVEPTPFNSTIPLSLRVAELRQKVADIMKMVTNRYDSTITLAIESLITEIQTDDLMRDHPIRPMLLEDLESAKKIVGKKGRVTAQETVEMMQHSAFLGTAKGLRSNTRHVPPPTTALSRSSSPQHEAAQPFLSPFSTRAQTQYATVMRTMSHQPSDEDDDVNIHK